MDKDIFSNHTDYWMVADNIKNLYLSNGSLVSLMDFERVLDEMDLYAFRNWKYGELVSGPNIGRYKVSCIFMYPERLPIHAVPVDYCLLIVKLSLKKPRLKFLSRSKIPTTTFPAHTKLVSSPSQFGWLKSPYPRNS